MTITGDLRFIFGGDEPWLDIYAYHVKIPIRIPDAGKLVIRTDGAIETIHQNFDGPISGWATRIEIVVEQVGDTESYEVVTYIDLASGEVAS